MKKWMAAFVAVAVAIMLAGCETAWTGSSKNRDRQMQLLKARTREAAKLNEGQARKISARVSALQEDYSEISGKTKSLRNDISALNGQNVKLQNAIAALKRELNQEKIARRESINKMADHLASETASAINSMRRSAPAPSGDGPRGKGKFYVYTVQPGATLSAIAKAYKVSVADIKNSNGLKGNIIRAGQKLYIPKK